jgi:hypothetical protein
MAKSRHRMSLKGQRIPDSVAEILERMLDLWQAPGSEIHFGKSLSEEEFDNLA